MKRFITFITVLVLFTSLFLACSSGVDSNDGNETESNETESNEIESNEIEPNEIESKTSIVTISYDEESSQDNDNLVLIFSFENFNVLPDKVDVYIENSEKAYKSGVSVQNGKITFPKPNVYTKTFYVKANNVESNHIDIDFIYRIDVDSLSVFMNSVPDNKIVKLQVTGKYNSFMTKIDLDLSRLEKPLANLYGFSKCISLKKITLPYEVTSVSNEAFECCSNLESVVLPEGLTSINQYAFRSCISLTDIKLPSSLTTIGKCAFWDCQYLESICIPDNVTKIGQNIFAGCSYLSNVRLPKTLTSIGFGWFQDCINLETIEIPDTVTSIGQCSFRGCRKLNTITIPENVTSIVVRAFEDCESLNCVVFQVIHNWKVGILELEEKELQDSANAATLLRETYKDISWTRM